MRNRWKAKGEPRLKWWKQKEEACCEVFREQARGGCEELPDDWITTATVIRETDREVFGASSGQRTGDMETWCWNEEIQESIETG